MTELRRIRKILRNPRFLERFFGEQEQEQYRERGMSANFIAGNFCAKEAFTKALGTGMRGHGLALRDIQILRDKLGAPSFYLTGAVSAQAQGLRFSLSITHTREYAVAFVVAWGQEGCVPSPDDFAAGLPAEDSAPGTPLCP
jgi:holo-[acyl-carrier protein] synthase